MNIAISTIEEEGSYQASKWIRVTALLDPEEMNSLLEDIGGTFHPLGKVISQEESVISSEIFSKEYRQWIENLKEGKVPEERELRKILACAWTADLDAIYLQGVGEDRYLARIRKPVVQINAHFFRYSSLDGEVRSKSFGKEGIFWGLEFSFPYVIQNAKTSEILIVNADFPNSVLFSSLRKWMRNHSRATPLIADGQKMNVPMRMGKKVEEWVHLHPSLKEQNLEVSL